MESRPRILVVDDEPRSRELLARTLRKAAEVGSAGSADEAWALFVEKPFDLVISDQRMPGQTGVDLLARISERDEHVGRILLTGYSDLEATVEAINRGRVHAYLHKPCAPDEIRVTMQAVLERTRLARENQRLVTELRAAVESADQAQARVLASERLAAIGKMVAMIAHDVRTPLTVLLAAGEEMRREGSARKDEALQELGAQVLEQGDVLRHLCDGLLDSVRAGQGGRERVATPLDEVVADAVAPLVDRAGTAGVQVDLDLRARVELPLDPYGLRRALQNLALNALEAMPDGGELRVQTSVEGGRALVRVSDNGPGIPAEIADRLFEPFVTAGKARGSGLGLAVVRAVVDDHGGKIGVRKPEGGGACFEIALPLASEAR
jgi:signal transduction histidine kinase